MVDIASISEGIALFKSGMNGIREVLGIFKDVRAALPESHRQSVSEVLERSEEQLRIAEAQIAKGLGYTLCMCEFPPTPMLTVGWIERGNARAVHQCPRCGVTDNAAVGWTPTEAIKQRRERA